MKMEGSQEDREGWESTLERQITSRGSELGRRLYSHRECVRKAQLTQGAWALTDPLTQYWLSQDGEQSMDSRIYMLEKVLPSLVPCVMQLLREADLSELKRQVGQCRVELQRGEEIQRRTMETRRECLALHFTDWRLHPLHLVQNALLSFKELLHSKSSDDQLAWDLNTDDSGTHDSLQQDQFVHYACQYVSGLSEEQFQLFLEHLSLCSREHGCAENLRHWTETLSQAFTHCDCAKTGCLDRERVLALLLSFYHDQNESTQESMHDPNHWPLQEDDHMTVGLLGSPVAMETEKACMPCDAGQGDMQLPCHEIKGGEERRGEGNRVTPTESLELGHQTAIHSPEPPDDRANIEEVMKGSGSDNPALDIEGLCVVVESGPLPEEAEDPGSCWTMCAYETQTVSRGQFLQLVLSFLGRASSGAMVDSLAGHIKAGYREKESERLRRLQQCNQQKEEDRRSKEVSSLFFSWDSEGRGAVDREEVERELSLYKDGAEEGALQRAWQHGEPPLSSCSVLSLGQFQALLRAFLVELPPEEGSGVWAFQELLVYLQERATLRGSKDRGRGATRQAWLQEIGRAAQRGSAQMEPVYGAVFSAVLRDAEVNAKGKLLSVSVALLEEEETGSRLSYVACTTEDARLVLNKMLQPHQAPVSFSAIESCSPVHVPRVGVHGGVYLFDESRAASHCYGSFIAIPILDPREQGRAIGVLGLDTLRDSNDTHLFSRHEIDFYQGVSSEFSRALHYVVTHRSILHIVESASLWLHSRVSAIHSITTYLMEASDGQGSDYSLRKMMVMEGGSSHSHWLSPPPSLHRSDHFSRDYLFQCCDTSQVGYYVVFGAYRLVLPVRDSAGWALGVVDMELETLSSGHQGGLQPHERRDLSAAGKAMQAACVQLHRESTGTSRQHRLLEAEGLGGERRASILFLCFMLEHLRHRCLSRLDQSIVAELQSSQDAPHHLPVSQVVKAVLLLLYPEREGSVHTDDWCQKMMVSTDLRHRLARFDPLARAVRVDRELVHSCIAGVERRELGQHRSLPLEDLYDWVSICLSVCSY
ncbi:EF-hand calcium-binding domain-containing protein 5-like [Coregonus clupeaformis]|uniref:EF-hand calcium-binding domain-containing protein 5-like n=1 Tax=Coregonus clupeaformis TaxID=59861 RepID=UPI001E1C8BEC|nr:EF-hand calcium-binding domain-containing protein 5-like [Coregonus clupeaformis]